MSTMHLDQGAYEVRPTASEESLWFGWIQAHPGNVKFTKREGSQAVFQVIVPVEGIDLEGAKNGMTLPKWMGKDGPTPSISGLAISKGPILMVAALGIYMLTRK